MGVLNEDKRYHLLVWEHVCLPKEWDRIGIKGIKDLNKPLLCKWVWRFRFQDNGLGKKIISLNMIQTS